MLTLAYYIIHCRQFFLNGKTLPVERGAGVGQRIMGVAARALAQGEWLHIFPEGRVTPDGRVGPFRQGIGRLVCDAKAAAGGRWVTLKQAVVAQDAACFVVVSHVMRAAAEYRLVFLHKCRMR